MIITRTPLRVSLFGGGSDLPDYLVNKQGQVFSMAINKYVYISIHPLVESSNILLKYSKQELVKKAREINHPVFRTLVEDFNLSGIDVSVSSDVSAGTGLGSSSAFTVGALKLFHSYIGNRIDQYSLAIESSNLLINRLREPIGLQDQFASSIGGINSFVFKSLTDVEVKPFFCNSKEESIIAQNFVLLRIYGERSASRLLGKLERTMQETELDFRDELVEIAKNGESIFREGPRTIGHYLDESWRIKRQLMRGISNSKIDHVYSEMLNSGFYGGKLLGAGQAGYLLLVGPTKKVKEIKATNRWQTLSFQVDWKGCEEIYNDEV